MARDKVKLTDEQLRFIHDELGIDAFDLSTMDKDTFDTMINELLFIECDEVQEHDDGNYGYQNSSRYQMVMSVLSCFERKAM